MRISLDSFESEIHETILKRGLAYWQKGHVCEAEEIEPGHWEVAVAGSDDYTVKIHIKNKIVEDFACTCPYDGAVCKHVVAVLFSFSSDKIHPDKSTTSRKGKVEKKSARKTVADQVEEILSKLNKKALDEFILTEAKENAGFRQFFLTRFANLTGIQGKELYAKQIKAILRRESDHGFLDYRRAPRAAMAVQKLLDNAEVQIQNNHIEEALPIVQAVAEEMCEALQWGDDSDGAISGCTENAFEIFYRLADAKLPEVIRKELFAYVTSIYEKKTFSGWDWHSNLLDLAVQLAADKHEADIVRKLIPTGLKERYAIENAKQLQMELTRKFEGEAAADKILEENLDLPDFRKTAIEKAFKSKDYNRVEKLAIDGIKKDKEYRGLVQNWREWLLRTAEAKKDIEAIVSIARTLFFDGHYSMNYYELMRKHVTESQWPAFLDQLLKDMKSRQRWTPVDAFAEIYVREKMSKNLCALFEEEPIGLHFMQKYEKPLAEYAPKKLCGFYESGIREMLEKNTGRKYYEEAARFLRRMKKLGFMKEAAVLVESLRAQYSKKPNLRPSLIEELKNV